MFELLVLSGRVSGGGGAEQGRKNEKNPRQLVLIALFSRKRSFPIGQINSIRRILKGPRRRYRPSAVRDNFVVGIDQSGRRRRMETVKTTLITVRLTNGNAFFVLCTTNRRTDRATSTRHTSNVTSIIAGIRVLTAGHSTFVWRPNVGRVNTARLNTRNRIRFVRST